MARTYRDGHPFVAYQPQRPTLEQSLERARACFERMGARRSVRDFSSDPVPRELVEFAIRTASTAPSGAHKQPWTFAAVSDPALKARIRDAAEAEEQRAYEGRMSDEWLEALAPLGTDAVKPYLVTAPWIVVLFAQRWGRRGAEREKHYYVQESCGIAAGLFVTAIHEMGLATLPHTPSPMGFLSEVLRRPENEKAMILFPVGYPAEGALVPDLKRKSLDDVSVWFP